MSYHLCCNILFLTQAKSLVFTSLPLVCMGPRKPGKSWNFVVAFSRTAKCWTKVTGPGKFWKSVKH